MAFANAYLRNNAINRVNLHTGIQALAQSSGGIFFVVFLVRSGVAIPIALSAMAGIVLARLALRPAILPLARRFGIKPLLILGTLILAAQYPLLAEVRGVGGALALLCAVAAVGEVLYWTSYNAYFAVIGDAARRGAQIGAREALTSVAAVIAPLLGAWALVTFGPGAMFAGVGVLQALAALPLIGAPNVAVQAVAPRAFAAARLGAILQGADGWFDAFFIFVWQIALFISLGASFTAYGGAMALAGLVGAASGLALGHHVDAGHGRRAVVIAYSGLTAIVLLRVASLGSPWAAIGANALGALLGTLMLPAGTAIYNLAKASPCPLRFHIATEGGWDIGCAMGFLIAAALTACGVSLALVLLMALPPLALASTLLRRHSRERYMSKMHDDEIETDAALVRRLLAAQFPQWAALDIAPVPSSGTDNAMYRLGDAMAVRLPRHPAAARQVDKEHRWLTVLAPQLALAIPVPLARGAPGEGYPLPWSICRWLDGETPDRIKDRRPLAADLAAFLVALQKIDTRDAPAPGKHNFWRGVPLAQRDPVTRAAIAALDGAIDTGAVTATWERDRDAPAWRGAPLWIHGDLSAGNLLVKDARLCAVIDFGGLAVGDPACDLAVAWSLFAGEAREVFRESLAADDASWARGRGWALSTALVALPYYRDSNPAIADGARRIIAAVLADG